MKNKYSGWGYFELCAESEKKYLTGKEARMLHKELKKHKSGLPLFMRYPEFPLYFSAVVALVVSVLALLKVLL